MVDLNEIFRDILAYMPKVSLTLYHLLNQTTVKYIDKKKTLKIGNSEVIIPAETDGLEIRLYKDWLDMPLEQKVGTIIHELLHILLRHPIRARNIFVKHGYSTYTHYLVNIAMDAKVNHAINQMFGKTIKEEFRNLFTEEELKESSVEELAEKLLNKYGNSLVQIYISVDVLPINMNNEKEYSDSKDSKDNNRVTILNKGAPKPKDERVENELVKRITDSIIKAKIAGASLSSIEERILKELLKPKVNWRLILKQSINDYIMKSVVSTWTKPNRKVEYYPGLKKISVPSVWCFIDVSGSISDEEFKQFMSEVAEITRHGGKVHVVTWDTEVTGYYIIKSKYKVINVKFKGGGGTKFTPAFEKFKDKIRHTDMIIILTDGYWHDKDLAIELLKPYTNRLIICTTGEKIPVGKNILINN